MLRNNTTLFVFTALAFSAISSGCLETQKRVAKDGCKNTYIGRQKAACDMGVALSVELAAKDTGETPMQKYQRAVIQCNKLELPLVAPCVSGVDRFRGEVAKIKGGEDVKPSNLAQAKRAKKATGRGIASVKKSN